MIIQYDELVAILLQHWKPRSDDVPPNEIITIQFPIKGKRRMDLVGWHVATNRRIIHIYAGEGDASSEVCEIEID